MKKVKKVLILFIVLLLALSLIYFIPERKKEIKTQHFTLLFSSSIDTAAIMELAIALESNYFRIGSDLQTTPSNNIQTNVYAQRWRYIKATGNWSASGNIEGISKLHFVEKAWGESDNAKVAVHEFAHTVTLKLLLDNEQQPVNSKDFDKKFSTFPVWLWEAISVYEANQFVDPKNLPYLNNGQYPTLSELDNRLKGGKIYDCGYTIIEYILSKYGHDNLISLVKNYGNLKKTFAVTDERFCKDWFDFVKAKYLK
ncbi:hypothetical protein [Flavisolibacter ginsenosidimutans]|uniref:Peptidase MA-like domain-containing protein n=1 Tax=Flavisolibacter ginsenosidimutans TaxID=661481 RepID=A0A5B8UG41_9BACT|nr:hypothetical protein [Flavisolibacter ginsenosidimutans]QEC55463.1 hypothetical protein FSB75_05945 [Flavisolibacter ginsenosidimutans]